MLDVIAIHLDGMNRCLDFCSTTPVDQGFRHCDLNLHCLKATGVKEVKYLTMVIVLDMKITHTIVALLETYSKKTPFTRRDSQMVQRESP